MASHSKTEVLAAFVRDGVVPVFSDDDLDVAKEIVGRLLAGGLSILEFTNRGDGAIGVFGELAAWARREHPGLVVGIGSVIDPGTASHAMDLGADFVFGPNLSPDVAAVCNGRNLPYVPGCGTLTEIQAAYRLGCDLVKLFPAAAIGGPAFLRAVRAPCPWVRAIPTGGVEPTVESLQPWFDAGAPAVGMGSKLLPGDLVGDRNWDAIQDSIVAAVAAVAAARS